MYFKVKQETKRTHWVTYHEIPNRPVEDCSIVVAFFTQTDEILSSFGHLGNSWSRVTQESGTKLIIF